MKHLDKLSYCGIYCGTCGNFKTNANCMGCRDEKKMLIDCPTRTCAIEKGLLHCSECDVFPCTVLDKFYTDGIPLHELAFKNMLRIREIGADKWLEEQASERGCRCEK